MSLDFIEGLPQYDRHNALLVIVDKFTKYGHFLPLTHPFTALTVAQLFMDNVYKLRGLPKAIIFDRPSLYKCSLAGAILTV